MINKEIGEELLSRLKGLIDEKIEEEILFKLKKNLASYLDIPKEKITKDSILREELGMDSLDKYLFCSKIKKEFELSISEEDMNSFTTVKDYMDYISIHKYQKYKTIF